MRFGVLGPLRAETAPGRPIAITERKVRALLAALLVHPGKPVSVDRLVEALWGDEPPPTAPSTLQTKISLLRRAFEQAEPGGRELVAFQTSGYLLRVDDDAVDATRFERLAARARTEPDPAARVALLDQALALWRGPAFAEHAEESFARAAATRLEEGRLTTLEEQAEARLATGEDAALVAELAGLVDRHPHRNRLRGAHMRALYRAGRQAEALASYACLREILAEDLGLDPDPELVALHGAILRRDPALGPTSASRPSVHGNLPRPVTELIGRTEAVAGIRAALDGSRLVTLTGPGGVGKTRLAMETAWQLEDSISDGVWLVELAALTRETEPGTAAIADAMLTVLAIREHTPTRAVTAPEPTDPLARLTEALRTRSMLLVIDNCEHLAAAVGLVAGHLLAAAPGLRILATSQTPLAIRGETLWPVEPLSLPGDPESVAESSAVQLFVSRAAASAPGFELTADNASTVAAICTRLDGIPLALELAAPRIRVLGAVRLLERLEDRFSLLTTGYLDAPPRQQTLRAMIDWSSSLLTTAERTLLRRLAVYADGCTLESAEAVCSGDGIDAAGVLDLISGLVDRSLVVVSDSADGPRYRLLESILAYAAERLGEASELGALRERHCRYYTALAETARPHLHRGSQRTWLARLDAESANLRGALSVAVLDHPDLGLRLVDALTWYWVLRGRFTEADRWLDAARRSTASPEGPIAIRAAHWHSGIRLLRHAPDSSNGLDLSPTRGAVEFPGHGRAIWFLAYARYGAVDMDGSRELVERALTQLQTEDDPWAVAAALCTRAQFRTGPDGLAAAARDGERSMAIFGELGDRWGQAQAAYPLASLAEIAGDYGRARDLHADGFRAAEELGLWREATDRLCGLARIALLTGDLTRSRELHERSLQMALEHGYRNGEVSAEIGLGLTDRRAGRLEDAEPRLLSMLDWGRRTDFGPITTLMLAELGFVAELRGDADHALALHSEGHAEALRLGDPRAVALAMEGLAGAHVLAGRPATAARLLGAASAARASVDAPLPSGERGDVDRITTDATQALGADDFGREFAAGAAQGLPGPPGSPDHRPEA
ncbi:BTAD domain-containing putative transcriptional regulator [Rhodococcus maanshanensis]|uniref:Predicted ATPase n=1 Tax=Rhodococcus maanshanensis TaxID=183556 RepID=A0A1H7H5U1_9NOCA|nr:BTAD domain-containing putative transcriptional regulator [Rhodococcus maanshanensis]SEK45661.1 Predicted ATPase [Rhodococcus maanshanensis]